MALNDQDRAWIREQIRTALHERSPWLKLRDFVPITAVVAIGLFVATQWTTYVEFRTSTSDRLTSIEKALGDIHSTLTKQSLINHASLPLADFTATLPDLGSAIAIANQQNLRVAPAIINDLQGKLVATDSTAPGFWGAAAQFINYRSQTSLPDFKDLLRSDLPRCLEHDPSEQSAIAMPDQHHLTLQLGTYENCKLVLDSPEDDARLNWLLVERFSAGIAFKHCLITYDGGPIDLILSIYGKQVTLTGQSSRATFEGTINNPSTLRFSDCLFQMMLREPPPDKGQEFTRTVLASKGETVQLGITAEKS